VRLNTEGIPTFLVRATEDEMRSKINSEASRVHRDFLIKLTPRDLLEDWEDAVYATMEKADKTDPQAALKKWLDGFHRLGIEPSELEQYFNKPAKAWGAAELQEMRELGQAIKEGSTTFAEALKQKYDQPLPAEAREARMEKQIDELEGRGKTAAPAGAPPTPAALQPSGPPANLPDLVDWPDQPQPWVKVQGVIYREGGPDEPAYVVWNAPPPPPEAAPRQKPVFGRKPTQ